MLLPLARSLIQVAVRTSDRSGRPCRLVHAPRAENAAGRRPARPSPTRPQEVIGFEEKLSELIARARRLGPHHGSRQVSVPLTFGVHCRTLSGEERCGRMIANPVKSTRTSTTPQLEAVLLAKRLCHLRRETALSPESMAGSSEARFNGSPFCAVRERRRS